MNETTKGQPCENCGSPKKTWRRGVSQWDGQYVCGKCEKKATEGKK